METNILNLCYRSNWTWKSKLTSLSPAALDGEDYLEATQLQHPTPHFSQNVHRVSL